MIILAFVFAMVFDSCFFFFKKGNKGFALANVQVEVDMVNLQRHGRTVRLKQYSLTQPWLKALKAFAG